MCDGNTKISYKPEEKKAAIYTTVHTKESGYTPKKDMVHSPNHYSLNINGMECQAKDVISAVTGKISDGYRAYCRGNELKYLIRADRKNGIEDLKKAKEYIDYEIARWDELDEDA